MNNFFTVTVGVAAYNAERNISSLVKALIGQNQSGDFKIEKIIVHSDASIDKTINILNEYKDANLQVVDNRERKGFVGSVRTILELSKSNITVLLNDDIKIEDKDFIAKLIQPFKRDSKVGLVSGNPQPLSPDTFIEQVAVSSFNVYEQMRLSIRDGRNQFTCDGKVMALSETLVKKFLAIDPQIFMGNLDTYLYFFSLEKGFVYDHSKEAVVYFRMPTTLKDYLKWSVRNNQDFQSIKNQFSKVAEVEFETPGLGKFAWAEFLKHPFAVVFLAVLRIYVGIMARLNPRFNGKWDLVLSTKRNI